jgi:TM2 domain-containing membrane protein YozV
MKGKILDYTVQTNQGVITGDDGNRYKFVGAEWKASTPPTAGSTVDFETNLQEARGIYLISGASGTGMSKRVAASLFAFFLGGFGAHKFYLGMPKPAVIMLCIWIFGWILLGIPTLVIGVIAFIEFIIYVTKSDAEFEQTYVVGRKAWF